MEAGQTARISCLSAATVSGRASLSVIASLAHPWRCLAGKRGCVAATWLQRCGRAREREREMGADEKALHGDVWSAAAQSSALSSRLVDISGEDV